MPGVRARRGHFGSPGYRLIRQDRALRASTLRPSLGPRSLAERYTVPWPSQLPGSHQAELVPADLLNASGEPLFGARQGLFSARDLLSCVEFHSPDVGPVQKTS